MLTLRIALLQGKRYSRANGGHFGYYFVLKVIRQGNVWAQSRTQFPMTDREEARAVLQSFGQSPILVLKALRADIGLSDFVMSGVVDRSAQTVRRWRTSASPSEIPDSAAAAIDDLRAIVAMLIEADYDGDAIRSFLRSRNTGLGQDRPLDGLRVGVSAFRRVEHVTECFIAGIAPEPGSALMTEDDGQLEPAIMESPAPEPSLPRSSVGNRR